MRAQLIAAGTAAAVAVAVLVVRLDSGPSAAPAGVPAPASQVAAPLPTPSGGDSPAPGEGGHQEDYDAPVEELIGHADHLDLSRLPPEKRAALEAELDRRRDARGVLWAAYGPALAGRPAPVQMPPALAQLELPEFVYVLMSVRAQRLGAAAGPGLDLAKAVEQTGGDHQSVTVRVRRSKQGSCLTVQPSSDPFGRVFLAQPSATAAGALAERLVRDVRVSGGSPVLSCSGQPPAFSAAALRAVEALEALQAEG